MKIRYLLAVAVLATAIFGFGGFVKAQTVDNSALIAQLQTQINALIAQLQTLLVQQNTGTTGTAALTVTSSTTAVLTTITVSPATVSILKGATQQFTATGYDQNRNVMSPQPTFTWTLSNNQFATINSATGVATGTYPGSVTVTAASGSVTGTAALTVTSSTTAVLTTITVSPATVSILKGATQQFTATGYDQNRNVMSPQPTFTWTLSNNQFATINSATGVATGTYPGSVTVTAASGSVTGTAALTVTSSTTAVLTTITVSPATVSILKGATQQFTATGYDQNRNVMSPQPTFTWTLSNNQFATINSATGVATGTYPGSVTVTAASGSVTGTAALTVTSSTTAVLTTITVSPATVSILKGATQQFTATGYDQNRNVMSPQPTFTWTLGNNQFATINSATGVATGTYPGSVTVTAASGSVTGTAALTVTSSTTAISVALTSPVGGESWKIGETHNITWTSANLPIGANVFINLRDSSVTGTGSTPDTYIGSAPASQGSYSWTIPSTITPKDNQYKVYIIYNNGRGTSTDNLGGFFNIDAPAPVTTASLDDIARQIASLEDIVLNLLSQLKK